MGRRVVFFAIMCALGCDSAHVSWRIQADFVLDESLDGETIKAREGLSVRIVLLSDEPDLWCWELGHYDGACFEVTSRWTERRAEGLKSVWTLRVCGPGDTWVSFHGAETGGGGDPLRTVTYFFELD